MSLDYGFNIKTALTPQQVLRIALAELGLEPETALDSPGVFKETAGPGFLASAGPVAPLSQTILQEDLGIAPSVNLHFWIDSGEERHAAITSMLQAGLAVLRQVPGDAVLLFIGETVLLLRRQGQLFLDERTGIWTPERLKQVDMPYTMKHFPVL
ncbi:SitI3 family protein [Stigmatella sp. ncwal1]|uniref:SitI3 family protein n=1 Tax=Stigmatella ashevillensis TaxID=2995309 RepID=A0ABT5DFN8_9BACT|nr:SitI3 family protein [Stigmatella ashevillena]MDC0712484.1 SitI3 family protein [Stigmatella ashevillena]